jgi:cytochrome P450
LKEKEHVPKASLLRCSALPSLPLAGNVFALRKERLALLSRISHEFGDIGAFHFGPRLVPLLNSPELIRTMLVDQDAHFEKTATIRALAEPVLGNGLFLSEGEEHRQRRRLLAPLFQHHRVLNYAQIISNHTVRLQETWKDGETINLADEMMRLTLWVISDLLFGLGVFGEERELGDALTETFRHFTTLITNPIHLPQSWPTPRNKRARQALARVNTTIYRMIEERRRTGETRNDFLSLLLRVEDEARTLALSTHQIRDEALSLFVAGHDSV